MMENVVPILAQASNITTTQQLLQLLGKGLGVGLIVGSLVCAYLIWRGLQMDRASGEWKMEILKGIMWFATPAIMNVLFYTFAGQTVPISF